jgi:hypothetical protein
MRVGIVVALGACAGPGAGALRVEPAEPTSADDLVAIVDDPTLDAASLRVLWRRRGEREPTAGWTLPASATRRGEVWRATLVGPRDGVFGRAFGTAEVTIGNSPPHIGRLRLQPAELRVDDHVLAVASGIHDEDGDEVAIAVRWFANGSHVWDGPELPPDAVAVSSRIEAVAVPSDGSDAGEPASASAGPLRPAYPDAQRWTGTWGDGCQLDDAGQAWCWGGGYFEADDLVPRPFGGDLRFVELAARANYGVDVAGTLWTWGWVRTGHTSSVFQSEPVPVGIPGAGPIVSVSANRSAGCAVDEAGRTFCWGSSRHGILPTAGQEDFYEPTLRFDVPRLVRVDVGEEHACGVDLDGAAWCWGREYRRRLGKAGLEPRLHEPVRVEGGPERWRRVLPGRSHTCGLDRDRRAWCWGYNAFGQLGSGTGPEDPGPVPVFGRHRWLALGAGDQSTCGLRDDDTLWCWGDDRDGVVGAGGPVRVEVPHRTGASERWRALSVADRAACGQRDDGSRWCWGSAA